MRIRGSTDANKCQLKPLDSREYGLIPFTAGQLTQLHQVFPSGVCDWSKRAVSQQPTIAWLSYQNAAGRVIYGGRPLGRAPGSTAFG